MRKQDNPVFVLGVLVVAVVLILAGWLFLPWFKDDSNTIRVPVRQSIKQDSLPCFLVLSDIHLHSSLLQSEIPNRAADSGRDLWDSAQNKIRSVLAGNASYARPEFIVVLGDLPWHADAGNQADLENDHMNSGIVLHDLRTLAENAHIPLMYVPANNDPWDGDYHPFSAKIFKQDSGCKSCWPLINPKPEDAIAGQAQIIDDTKLSLGCYSAYPLGKKGRLRAIALNTTMFVHKYTDEGNQQANAAAQMKWFGAQLAQAAEEKEFVLIAMHVPPGLDGYQKKDFWSDKLVFNGTSLQNAFIDLLDKYQSNIIGLLSSHTHMDGLRRLYNHNKKLIAVDISVPGVAPGHGNNPGFKLISYQPDNFSLQNFRTFYENFFPANNVVSWGNDQYDFRSEFGCPYGSSMRDFLDTLNLNTLQNAVQSIYKVENGRGDAKEVNSAIDVRYE